MRHSLCHVLLASVVFSTIARGDEAHGSFGISAHQLRSVLAEPPRIPAGATDPIPAMDDEEVDERSAFLEQAIKRNARLTQLWHGLFVTMYATGLVVEVEHSVAATDAAARADYAVSAAKAVIGVAGRAARPLRAVLGPRPIELYPGSDRISRARRLLVAERILRIDAKDNDRRYFWVSHVVNVGFNLVGMFIVGFGYHDWGRAGESAGIGIAVGELSIWSQPWTAKHDWRTYQREFGAISSAALPKDQRPAVSSAGGASNLLAITF